MALFLKHQLEQNERYLSFANQCSDNRKITAANRAAFFETTGATNQGTVAECSKACRVGATGILAYQAAGDFTAVDPTYVFDVEGVSVGGG